jgi:hypothetical protein
MFTISDYATQIKAYDRQQDQHRQRQAVLLRKLAKRLAWAAAAEENALRCKPAQVKAKARYLAKAQEHREIAETLDIQQEKQRIKAEYQNLFAAELEQKTEEARTALADLREGIVANGHAYRAAVAEIKRLSILAGNCPTLKIKYKPPKPNTGFDSSTLTEAQIVAAAEYFTSRHLWDIGSGRGEWTRAEAAQMLEATIGRAVEMLCERTPSEWQERGVGGWIQAVASVRSRLRQAGWRIAETTTGVRRAPVRKAMPGKTTSWGAGMNPATVISMTETESVVGIPHSYKGGRPVAKRIWTTAEQITQALTGQGTDESPNTQAEPIRVPGGDNYRLPVRKMKTDYGWHELATPQDASPAGYIPLPILVAFRTHHMEESRGAAGGAGEGKSDSSSFPACSVQATRPAPAYRHAPERTAGTSRRRWFAIHPDAAHGKADWHSHVGDAKWPAADKPFDAEGVSQEWADAIDARRMKWMADLQRLEDAAG